MLGKDFNFSHSNWNWVTKVFIFSKSKKGPALGKLNPDNKEPTFLGICQKCFNYTSSGVGEKHTSKPKTEWKLLIYKAFFF